jgi:phage shock protein C
MMVKAALRRFRLDRRNGKVLGVCAGIANQTGWDVTFVRVGVAMLMILGPLPWTLVPYLLVGIFARQQGAADEPHVRPLPKATEEVIAAERALNARAAEIDSVVAGENSSLAREIEKLRQS